MIEILMNMYFIIWCWIIWLIHFKKLIIPFKCCFKRINILGIKRIKKRILKQKIILYKIFFRFVLLDIHPNMVRNFLFYHLLLLYSMDRFLKKKKKKAIFRSFQIWKKKILPFEVINNGEFNLLVFIWDTSPIENEK